MTLTVTETSTPLPTPEETTTTTPLPTETPFDDCLVLTSPKDFYHNTVLISWTPILNVSYYILDFVVNGSEYSANVNDNFVRITLTWEDEWHQFVEVGEVPYRVTAYDSNDNVIDGPTAWANIVCQADCEHISPDYPMETAALGCLRITSPCNFAYNTILLSWTPITGADHYTMEYKFMGDIYTADIYDNWLRFIVTDREVWNTITGLVGVEYRISAIDSDGNIIDGPTEWSSFVCK